jgi:metallo-beta-lactamase family protein
MATLQFLGGTRTVTGSKYLVEAAGRRVLIDCGLFQGLKELRLRNWEPLPLPPSSIDAVILTHAHIDHSGYLPRLVKDGFSGPVFCSSATFSLCRILLRDSAKIQEEDAAYANRMGFSKHKPALPLFTEGEAERALNLFCPVPYRTEIPVNEVFSFRNSTSGHVLGSCFVELSARTNGTGPLKLVFSGDIGRYDKPILNDPAAVSATDYLVVESTYGDRLHGPEDPGKQLREIIIETIGRGGTLLIPAFAVGRVQDVLYLILQLKEEKSIPDVPVFLDSPMAIQATEEYLGHIEEHNSEMRDNMRKRLQEGGGMVTRVRSSSESQGLANRKAPSIVISSSGMATGGRVLHHLTSRLPDPRNTVLFVGYQAQGTRGHSLVSGAHSVKIHGRLVPVGAQIKTLNTLSAHADYSEILLWLEGFQEPPAKTFVVHGEQSASVALQSHIRDRFGWEAEVPMYGETVLLPGRH